ncbi:MAG: hypothetical protein JNM52_01885, partial [Betaproteobacteria bacterium]|nr:hypothetical protein [Betaproteobacteria bacterium]
MKSIISAILAASLVGCASPPAVYNVEKTRPLTAPYDVAWDKLVAFFATNNLQIKNIAKDSGVIYAEMLRVDGRFADCGSPGLVRVIEQRTV